MHVGRRGAPGLPVLQRAGQAGDGTSARGGRQGRQDCGEDGACCGISYGWKAVVHKGVQGVALFRLSDLIKTGERNAFE